MNITKITIIQREHFADKLVFDTDLPGSLHPYDESLPLYATVAKGFGPEYCAKYFPEVQVEVVVLGV